MSFLDNFSFQIYGDEHLPKLVFLHGVMGSSANWRKIIPHFADRYHILAFDQRGHGSSFHPPRGYEPEDYAEDLRQILDELGWDKIFLVGHSMGGRNALHFAFKYPQRVKGLVIEDIHPASIADSNAHLEELLRAVPVPFATRKDAKEFFLNEFVSLFSDKPQIHQVGQFLYSNIIENEDGQGVWRFYHPGIIQSIRSSRSRDRWQELQKISVPTLVIRGENSPDLSREDYKKMLSLSPFVQGVEIPGAGHWVHTDRPEEFSRALDHFLSQIRTIA